VRPHAHFGIMHCVNAGLSGQAITLAVAVKQASGARAPIDLASCRHPAWWKCRTSKPSPQRARNI